MTTQSRAATVTYGEMIAFFLPVAASMMIMMTSHSVVSSALARTTDAAMALAAYSVAKSISNMFQSPCITLRRMCVALFKDQESYDKVVRVAIITCAAALAIIGIAVFTPLKRYIFVNIIGVSEELLPHTVRAFTILMVMPLLAAVRSVYQGAITVSRRTYLLTIATAVRIVVMFLLATFITTTQVITGSVVGSILMVAGIGTEALFAYIFGRNLKETLPTESEQGKQMTFGSMWLYFLPLVIAQFVMTWGQPTVNAGLARSTDPEMALASYQVARSFAWIFIGIFGRVHQLTLVFVRDRSSWIRVRRFALGLGLVNTALLLIISLTPVGEWILLHLIGVDVALTDTALRTIAILAFLPLVMSQNECYSGLLMSNNRTPVITLGRMANIATLMAVVFAVSKFFPHMGALIGSLSLLMGYCTEFIIYHTSSRRILRENFSDAVLVKDTTVMA